MFQIQIPPLLSCVLFSGFCDWSLCLGNRLSHPAFLAIVGAALSKLSRAAAVYGSAGSEREAHDPQGIAPIPNLNHNQRIFWQNTIFSLKVALHPLCLRSAIANMCPAKENPFQTEIILSIFNNHKT